MKLSNYLAEQKNNEGFEKLVYDKLGQEEDHEKLRHNILNVRRTMRARHQCFKKMRYERQYQYCETIAIIAYHTQAQHMNENRPISTPDNKRYSMSIDRDWKVKEYTNIQIDSPKDKDNEQTD